MKFQLTVFVAVLILCFGAADGALAQGGKNPTFAQFAAKKMTGKAAPVDFNSHSEANNFRTRLKEAASGAVNFAGSFVIAIWGCGTGCVRAAVINAKTGAVYFPGELSGTAAAAGNWAGDKETLEFKPNSRLLILRGKPGNYTGDGEGIFYFEWTGKVFRKIKFVEVKPNENQ